MKNTNYMFIIREYIERTGIYIIIQRAQYKEYIKIYVVRLICETDAHQL